MNPYNIWFALFAAMGFAVIAPPAMFLIYDQMAGLPTHVRFLATAILPLLALLMGASWLEPGGVGP